MVGPPTLKRSLTPSEVVQQCDFVSFVEMREAEVITIDLALRWATREPGVSRLVEQSARWSFVDSPGTGAPRLQVHPV